MGTEGGLERASARWAAEGEGRAATAAPATGGEGRGPAASSATGAEGREWTARLVGTALACALLVGLAVALEVVAGGAANSPVPAWAEKAVPLAWPQPLRVAWWLGVAAAAYGFRASLRRLGLRQRPVVVVLSVAPFVVFAVGVALGASWATWH